MFKLFCKVILFVSVTAILFLIDLFVNTTDLTCAEQTGWYIQMDSIETDAQAVEIWVGTPDQPYTYHFWKRWTSSEDDYQDLPAELQDKDSVWIRAIAVPNDKTVHMFVRYRNDVPQEMKFTGQQEGIFRTEFTDED